jgi:hypothetical protein
MSDVTGFMVLNPGMQATPLNFRAWLRNSLVQYAKEQGQPGVVALVFLTPHYINAVGRKKLEKMLTDAARKHRSWLRAINMMTTPVALSDDEVEKIVEEMLVDSAKARDDGHGDVHLGYVSTSTIDPDGTPVCMIRRVQDKDLEVLRQTHSDYQVGDWYVMGEIEDRQALSQPQKTLDEAYKYAGDFFEAKHFSTGR